ncbi:hypothetical protein KDC22_08710 [Paenibacillus tritici]|uniref:hypothetical protein n=1 Tax=Paenibacillus tritici TaxID=1873425 RepID=UPI001BA78806|nr:hypothetical protein [Paenibacillus tritici]QUL56556.1 hypothetical protein KDC22_08710 [Paenibacillus tritici]
MNVIKNFEVVTDNLNVLGAWTFKEIIGINYTVDYDYKEHNITLLTLLFHIVVIKTGRRFKMKIKYYNVSDLSVRKITNLYLNKSLIVHDKKELGWEICKR